MTDTQKIVPSLWFDRDTVEAIAFYISVFNASPHKHRDSRLISLDRYESWDKLSVVPEAEQCGWIKDKFGVSWQIVPRQLGELLAHPERKKALAATNAMLKMKKIVIADVQRAFDEA